MHYFAGFFYARPGISGKIMPLRDGGDFICHFDVYFECGKCHRRSHRRRADSTSGGHQRQFRQSSSINCHLQSQLLATASPSWSTSRRKSRGQECEYRTDEIELIVLSSLIFLSTFAAILNFTSPEVGFTSRS